MTVPVLVPVPFVNTFWLRTDSDRLSLQEPSDSPYAHWSWYQPLAASNQENDCVRAMGDSAYVIFAGSDPSRPEQAANMANYLLTGNRVYGWVRGRPIGCRIACPGAACCPTGLARC